MKKTLLILILTFVITLPVSFGFEKVGLFYKASEGEYGVNMHSKYIIPVLEDFGVDYKLIDIEGYMEGHGNFSEFSGIVSFYYSGVLEEAIEYLESLKAYLSDGGIYYFFNSIGALSNGTTYLEQKWINGPLNLMGVQYSNNWQTLERYEYHTLDMDYLLEKPKIKENLPVEIFNIFGKNTQKILSVQNSKREFPMIFLSENGGGAVFNSFMNENEVNIDLHHFLHSLENPILGDSKNKVLIVRNTDSDYDRSRLEQLTNALYISRMDYNIKTTDEIQKTRFRKLSEYELFILPSVNALNSLTIDKLLNSGRSIVYLTDIINSPWGSLKKEANTFNIESLNFSKHLSPLGNDENGNIFVNWNFTMNYTLELTEGHQLLAWFGMEAKIPAIWYAEAKNGSIGYIDPKILNKLTRGLVIRSLNKMIRSAITPIINSYTFQIDDFILPGYESKVDFGESENITDNDYYYNVWWNDVKKLVEEYNLNATVYPVLNYNSAESYPFQFQDLNNDLKQRGIHLLQTIERSGYEIGLHGYNHIHLTKENWEDPLLVIESLKRSQSFLNQVLGRELIIESYVAPNNIIDEFGVEALLKAIPTVKNIGTTFESYDAYSEYRIINEDVLIMPRSTYGYYPKSRIISNSVNSISNYGGFEHFIHPDDAFAYDRNPAGKPWKDMLSIMENFYSEIKVIYPWMKNHHAAEHSKIMIEYLTMPIRYQKHRDKISVYLNPSVTESKYFYLDTTKKLKNIIGGRLIWYYIQQDLYVIEMEDQNMDIYFF